MLSFLLKESTIESIKDAFSIIGGVASFIVMIIAIMLYDKFGIEKTIKEKNLDVSLKLLEEIKKITIVIKGYNYKVFYDVTKIPINAFEEHYGEKLLFPENYREELNSIFVYTNNLYLPREIKEKLDAIIPYSLGALNDGINNDGYGKVIINYRDSTKWMYNHINNETDIKLYDYLIKWDELIFTIQNWCKNNSDSKIDLNIK